MHHDDKIDPESGDMKKPEIITFYNSTKGGVDMVDQMAGEYDTSRNSRRWPLTVFYTLLNVSTINAYILYCRGAHYVDRDRSVNREGIVGRSHGILKN